MGKDVNEIIVDDFMRHSIDLDRLAEGQRKEALTTLKALEKEMVERLRDEKKLTSYEAARTEALLQQTRGTIAKTYKRLSSANKSALLTIYGIEKAFVAQAYNSAIGSSVATVFVDPRVTARAVDGTLIDGAPSSAWWGTQSNQLKQRFDGAVRSGILSGETNDQIVKRIRGTKEAAYANGIMSVSRREASALARTSVQAVANRARLDTFEDNMDIIKQVQQISTLDLRTTLICQSYSGLVWSMQKTEGGELKYVPVGHSKGFANVDNRGVLHFGPPRHWGCRSALVPITPSWEELAGKEVKLKAERPATFQSKFKKRLEQRGFSKEQIADIKAHTQSSMRGQVPRGTTYQKWLTGESERSQIEALGRGRWKLWKAGRIKNLRQLTDNQGRPLTIDQYTQKVQKATFETLKTEEQMRAWSNTFLPWKQGLSFDEREALRGYQRVDYTPINKYLRHVDLVKEESDLAKNSIRKLDSSLKKSVIPSNVRVFRGVANDVFPDENITGWTIDSDSYLSTSLSKTVAKKFTDGIGARTILELDVPAGTHGAALETTISKMDEFEVLLSRGLSYKIIRDNTSKGVRTLRARLL